MSLNYYEILEIPSDADEREIKKAYHRLARELHPDKAATPEEARQVEERFSLISAAYNTLKSAEKRAEYNRGMARAGQTSGGGTGTATMPGTATARVLQAGRARAGVSAPGSGGATATAAAAGAGASTSTPRPAQGITPERVAIAQKAFARGMQYFKEDNLAKAISFFEAAIQNNDQEAIYHSRLAMTLIRDRRSATRAIDAAQRAIDLDPYNMEHKFNLALIYETIGSTSNAQRIYEEILRWEADNQRAKLALMALQKRRGPFGFGGGKTAKPAAAPNGNSASGGLMATLKRLLGRQ